MCAKRLDFVYDSVSPSPYRVPQKNAVSVWVEDGAMKYSRRYINERDRKAGPCITHTFEENATPLEVAKTIHWGCSGTSKNGHELQSLIEKIQSIEVTRERDL